MRSALYVAVVLVLLSSIGCRSYSYNAPDGGEIIVETFMSNTQAGLIEATRKGDQVTLKIESLSTEHRLAEIVQSLADIK